MLRRILKWGKKGTALPSLPLSLQLLPAVLSPTHIHHLHAASSFAAANISPCFFTVYDYNIIIDTCLFRSTHHDSLNPAPTVSFFSIFSQQRSLQWTFICQQVFLLWLLYFLRINSQKEERRVKGNECFCSLCYIMHCCCPKGTMPISSSKARSVKLWFLPHLTL